MEHEDRRSHRADALVSATAKAQGFTIILDRPVAGPNGTGLMISADAKSVDLTGAVIARIKK